VPVLKWKATAVADLLAIIDYISDDNPDAAQALKDEIAGKTLGLPEHPQMYRVGRVYETREMVVRPNYIVVYAESPDDGHSAARFQFASSNLHAIWPFDLRK